ncbi:arginine N-succinyltransferase [Acetobacter oeni]|uniref:Arginine N-succinyltransferase n=1 Tax=Acetobacter oeni TaxID=304077 RepID=A0A511XIX8_9PROT|nr:arginine/ornithine N-succinyltransferase beta subunit [Acetobacter oeni LMG 21952]GEN62902.1 arginine N-succinyltransferase [Acetobacter oeni]
MRDGMTPASVPDCGADLYDPWIVRVARLDDLDRLFALAAHTGGGLLNLPCDRSALRKRLEWSENSVDSDLSAPDNELYFLVLENESNGTIAGSACIFSRIGTPWPFYSYKIATHTHVSRELGRTFSSRLLHLVNDFDGASEVGGLFLHPDYRTGGLGSLLARSRYLFIARHRRRFADRIIADLRGYAGAEGPPFWNAVGRIFFGRDFAEADHYNALHGNQFISDLMPRYPIYIDLLPKTAQAMIGRTHDLAIPARKMLEMEGFVYDGYIDIFDGGPTLSAITDHLRTLRLSQHAVIGTEATNFSHIDINQEVVLIATGYLQAFRVWRDCVTGRKSQIVLRNRTDISSGMEVLYICRNPA